MSNTPNETQKPSTAPSNPQQNQQGDASKQNQGDNAKPGSAPQQK